MLHRTPFILPLLYPGLMWRMPSTTNELYLTFDDGPVPGVTEFVLEVLSKHHIHATFFCIGDNIFKYPAIFEKVVAGGHTIGNHTFNHLKGWQTKTEEYLENVVRCDQIIHSKITRSEKEYFRPPYGRITRRQIKLLADKKIVMWDVLTRDYDKTLSPESCLKASLKAVRNGSIIVFHDSLKAKANLTYVLPRFIERCLQQGYTFKPMV